MATRAQKGFRDDLADRIDTAAAAMGRPRIEVVEEVIEDWLDTEDWKHSDTLAAMIEARHGPTIDNERVVAWIDSLSTDDPLPMPEA